MHRQIAECNRLIYDTWLNERLSYAALGREFGISASLVRQIIATADRIALDGGAKGSIGRSSRG